VLDGFGRFKYGNMCRSKGWKEKKKISSVVDGRDSQKRLEITREELSDWVYHGWSEFVW
jgi:hypothetical protein